MKVILKHPVRSFAGISKDKTLVYRSFWDECVYVASVYVCPTITEHNHKQGSKLTRANILYKQINTAFIEDLKIYAIAYNKKHSKKKRLAPNFYNIFIKALCNSAVQISDLDSIEKFVSVFGNTIEDWIANGLLPKVKAVFKKIEVWVNEEASMEIQPELDTLRNFIHYIMYNGLHKSARSTNLLHLGEMQSSVASRTPPNPLFASRRDATK